MLAKRIVPCLDVKDGKVVKGIQFKNHRIVGDIVELAKYYSDSGADELVFYDIAASSDKRSVSKKWVCDIAKHINIPFCVAGGIRSVEDAEKILNSGADKISINSPALENPNLINDMAKIFGQQCIVIGIDSLMLDGQFVVCQYTGSETKSIKTKRDPLAWIKEVQDRGAGEIVVNCMNQDGVKKGYDIEYLTEIRAITTIPIIASGGAGKMEHFSDVFSKAKVDGALAASVFHSKAIDILDLKRFLNTKNIPIRII
ncbi:MAG: cyclase [Francisellaceae bacterium]|jgi:cyclase